MSIVLAECAWHFGQVAVTLAWEIWVRPLIGARRRLRLRTKMITEDEARTVFALLLGREPESQERIAVLAAQVDSVVDLWFRILSNDDYRKESSTRLGSHRVPRYWPIRGEPSVTFREKLTNGFFESYVSGRVVIDVGYRGDKPDAVPILPHAVGVDFGFPGYDGKTLPFPDESVDTVYSSHTLEHIADYKEAIRDWYRVARVGGFVVCIVPHQFLYEKRRELPSRWNPDHKRFYTPASLLAEFEEALEPNSYRVRHCRDNDFAYSYQRGPDQHADVNGSYEIELVIQKIKPPLWKLA
jgi:hypothetical protein